MISETSEVTSGMHRQLKKRIGKKSRMMDGRMTSKQQLNKSNKKSRLKLMMVTILVISATLMKLRNQKRLHN